MFGIVWCDKYGLSVLCLYSPRRAFAAATSTKKKYFVTFCIAIRMCDDI